MKNIEKVLNSKSYVDS